MLREVRAALDGVPFVIDRLRRSHLSTKIVRGPAKSPNSRAALIERTAFGGTGGRGFSMVDNGTGVKFGPTESLVA